MSNAFTRSGLQDFAAGDLDWDANTIKAILINLTADVGVKAITGATNATPIVVTATSHGFTDGDTVLIKQVAGNLAANNIWVIQNSTTHTFELISSTGSAAYTSGGFAINLGPSAAGDKIDDYSAGRVGTDQTLGSKTNVGGVLDAADPTWTALSGSQVDAVMIYASTGVESTSRTALWLDGYTKVTVAADAASTATTLWVEALEGPVASGQTIVFSNGVTATLGADAAAGARSLTTTALPNAIAAGCWGQAKVTGSGLPFTPSGGSFTLQFDNNANKIGRI